MVIFNSKLNFYEFLNFSHGDCLDPVITWSYFMYQILLHLNPYHIITTCLQLWVLRLMMASIDRISVTPTCPCHFAMEGPKERNRHISKHLFFKKKKKIKIVLFCKYIYIETQLFKF